MICGGKNRIFRCFLWFAQHPGLSTGTRTTMSDFLKSALGYFNAGPVVGGNGGGGQDNEFVGQIVEVGTVKLRIKRVIAEGGWKKRQR